MDFLFRFVVGKELFFFRLFRGFTSDLNYREI